MNVCPDNGLPIVCENGLPLGCLPAAETYCQLSMFLPGMRLARLTQLSARCLHGISEDVVKSGRGWPMMPIVSQYGNPDVSQWDAVAAAQAAVASPNGLYFFSVATDFGMRTFGGLSSNVFGNARFIAGVRRTQDATMFTARGGLFVYPTGAAICDCTQTSGPIFPCCGGTPHTCDYLPSETVDPFDNFVIMPCVDPCNHSAASIQAARYAQTWHMGTQTVSFTLPRRLTDAQMVSLTAANILQFNASDAAGAVLQWSASFADIGWSGRYQLCGSETMIWSPNQWRSVDQTGFTLQPPGSALTFNKSQVVERFYQGYQSTNPSCANYSNPLPVDTQTVTSELISLTIS